MSEPVLPAGYQASNVSPFLWIGAAPPGDQSLHGFHALVLCAAEVQPTVMAFRGHIWRVRLYDTMDQSLAQVNSGIRAGRAVAKAIGRGEHVLVTCYAGQNRSAFVAGLALLQAYDLDGSMVIDLIRRGHSPTALSNPEFCRLLIEYGENLGRHRLQRSVGG